MPSGARTNGPPGGGNTANHPTLEPAPFDSHRDVVAMRSFRGLCAALTALGSVAACSPPSASPPTVGVRDSAGVRIVELAETERFPAPWQKASEPEWAVGELEGEAEYLLSRVAGAMVLPGGETVIANGDTSELRFFDANGIFTRSLGGMGEGPGEFEYLRALGPCFAGGFVAFDLNWQRNSYQMDGTFVEKTVLRAPSGITPYTLACDDEGHLMILGWGHTMDGPPPLGFYQARDRLVLAGDDDEVAVDFGERLVSERLGTPNGSGPHPAGRATRFAIHDGRAYIGSGEQMEVEEWSLDGALVSLIRGPQLPLEVTEAVRSIYLESQLESIEDPNRRAARRTAIGDMEWPERLPAYTDLKVDPTGVIWALQHEMVDTGIETWSLLHPERAYLGDVALGLDQSLLEIGEDYLLVLHRDELGVERVLRLALERTAS